MRDADCLDRTGDTVQQNTLRYSAHLAAFAVIITAEDAEDAAAI